MSSSFPELKQKLSAEDSNQSSVSLDYSPEQVRAGSAHLRTASQIQQWLEDFYSESELQGLTKPLGKQALVETVARKASVTKEQADAVLSAVLETIVEAVSAGNKVTLVGFGSFESRDRKARAGRNPQTGDKIEIPSTRVPAFSAGKLFKEKTSHRFSDR
jgi:DNA-binding protein HU-beta